MWLQKEDVQTAHSFARQSVLARVEITSNITHAKLIRRVVAKTHFEVSQQQFIYSVFTKDTLDEKGQARDTSVHVTIL